MSAFSDLANLIGALKHEGRQFVLMLGAGASISSDVPDARKMMKAAVERYGSHIAGADFEEKFDKLMEAEENRRAILKPYLDKKPSKGYQRVAELIRDGYFETVITFNFDVLLETALHNVGVHDFSVIVRGEYEEEGIPEAVDLPGIKIVKLHGSLKGFNKFIFTREDLVVYPEPIRKTVEKLTAKDIIVCGYAYIDQCVISSFSKNGPGNVVIVNPNPPQYLCDVAKHRKAAQFVFEGTDGRFDDFFAKLSEALAPRPDVPVVALQNPFKYLEAYRAEDSNSFFGREDLVGSVSARLQDANLGSFFIAGKPKVGKTSFVRAGLMPVLKPEPLYLRCQADLEKWLPLELARRYPNIPTSDLATALQALASTAGPRFYVVLDQFERVIRPYGQMPNGQEEFSALLQRLISSIPETLTMIYVATETEIFLPTLIELKISQNCQMVRCESAVVANVINKLTAQAGITFEQAVIEQLQMGCGKSDPREPFTLAHVTAICHLLCDSGDLSIASLGRILEDHGDTLNRIINQYDVMGFIEDIPFDAAARALLPRMLKVISKEARRSFGGSPALVAECLTSHFGELFPKVA